MCAMTRPVFILMRDAQGFLGIEMPRWASQEISEAPLSTSWDPFPIGAWFVGKAHAMVRNKNKACVSCMLQGSENWALQTGCEVPQRIQNSFDFLFHHHS